MQSKQLASVFNVNYNTGKRWSRRKKWSIVDQAEVPL